MDENIEMHYDKSDVLLQMVKCSISSQLLCGAALLCLTNAKSGGLSGWSSSISVHNEIVRRRPDLARVLAGPWFFDRKGEVPEGKKGYFELPVFNYYQVERQIEYRPSMCSSPSSCVAKG